MRSTDIIKTPIGNLSALSLRRKIEYMQSNIDSGRAKAFYSELLIVIRKELDEKESILQKLYHEYEPLVTNEVNIALIKSDLTAY